MFTGMGVCGGRSEKLIDKMTGLIILKGNEI
jgi:hypothetical protein